MCTVSWNARPFSSGVFMSVVGVRPMKMGMSQFNMCVFVGVWLTGSFLMLM